MEHLKPQFLILYLLAATGSVALYHSMQIDEGAIYRARLMGRYVSPRDRLKSLVKDFFYKIVLTEEVVKNIGKVGGTTETYLRRFIMYAAGMTFIGLSLKMYFLCFLGPLFGWAYSTLGLKKRVSQWRQGIMSEIPTLIRMLKIRFAVHDTVPNAIINVEHMLNEPLAREWSLAVAEMIGGKKPLDEALDNLDSRVGIRELTSVIARLKSYNRLGPPEEPFGDMADTLTRIAGIKAQYAVRRMTTPLMVHVSIGFVALALMVLVPWLVMFLRQVTFY
ncbi:MAG: type II secretion system F family protein [Bacillota bacterium]